ncbi:MAG: FHA domain-containing protein [Planctomycetales bacterium]
MLLLLAEVPANIRLRVSHYRRYSMYSSSAVLPIVRLSRDRISTFSLHLIVTSLAAGITIGLSQTTIVAAIVLLFASILVLGVGIRRSIIYEIPQRFVPLGLAPQFAIKLRGASILVGRGCCCDICLPLPTVSNHHCRIFSVRKKWFIEDLNSFNGTILNGRRIRKKRPLRVGDRVSIGEDQFMIR